MTNEQKIGPRYGTTSDMKSPYPDCTARVCAWFCYLPDAKVFAKERGGYRIIDLDNGVVL